MPLGTFCGSDRSGAGDARLGEEKLRFSSWKLRRRGLDSRVGDTGAPWTCWFVERKSDGLVFTVGLCGPRVD